MQCFWPLKLICAMFLVSEADLCNVSSPETDLCNVSGL